MGVMTPFAIIYLWNTHVVNVKKQGILVPMDILRRLFRVHRNSSSSFMKFVEGEE